MKILLIEPPKTVWELMGGNCVCPPLGLAQLAAVLEKEDIDVDIVDCNASEMSWSDLEAKIAKIQPDVIGATALTPFFITALKTVEIAKEADRRIVTVLGGPHITFTAEETLREHPEIDVLVRGEGEQTFLNLINCLEKGGDLSHVKGIAYRNSDEVLKTPAPRLLDVNELPLPAYHLLPMSRYHFTVFGKFTTILTSRGCPYNCTFCSEWRFWGACWRPRKPEDVVDEMELLHKKYGRESFWLGDDCFNVDHEHIHGICTEIIERNLDIFWFYQGRADLLINHKDLLPEMRDAGNLMAQIGIETSKDEEMNSFRKELTTDHVKKAVELLKKHDIVSQGLMIVGTREDNADSIIHKVRYMKWLDVDFPIFTMFTPFPGSDVYEDAQRNNWLETLDYSKYDMAHAIMPTEQLSTKQLTSLYYWCFSSCYLDPVKVAKGLLSTNKWKRQIWRHMLKYNMKKIIH